MGAGGIKSMLPALEASCEVAAASWLAGLLFDPTLKMLTVTLPLPLAGLC
jgi:hypothetical protein